MKVFSNLCYFYSAALSPKGNEKCIDVDDCDYIKLKRIPHVHRGVSIASDLKGRNFAVIQTHPKSGILIPYIESTDMKRNMKTLLETASEYDTLHDVVFDVSLIFKGTSPKLNLSKLFTNARTTNLDHKRS